MARMRQVNVDGVIHTIRAVATGMKDRAYGRIANITSNAAIGTALPGTTFYAATKAEVLILTRRFAMELGRNGITVNAVAPGWIVTEMARAGWSQQEFEARVRHMSDRTMVGRAGRPDEVANAVAFLAAPESGFVTAQVLTIDGGRMDYSGTAEIVCWGSTSSGDPVQPRRTRAGPFPSRIRSMWDHYCATKNRGHCTKGVANP